MTTVARKLNRFEPAGTGLRVRSLVGWGWLEDEVEGWDGEWVGEDGFRVIGQGMRNFEEWGKFEG